MRNRSTLVLVIYALLSGSLAWFGTVYAVQAKALPPNLSLLLLCALVLVWGLFAWICFIVLGRWMFWIMPLCCLVLAGALVVGGIYAIDGNRTLTDKGVQTNGVASKRVHHITNHYVDFVYVGKSDGYSLDYTFTVDGRTYSSQNIDVSRETWDRAGINPTLPIRYLPENPGLHEIDFPAERSSQGLVPWLFFGGAVLAVLAGIRAWERRPRSPAASARRTPVLQRRTL